MELDPTGMPVDLDGVVLATPGLQGNAEVHYGGGARCEASSSRRPRSAGRSMRPRSTSS